MSTLDDLQKFFIGFVHPGFLHFIGYACAIIALLKQYEDWRKNKDGFANKVWKKVKSFFTFHSEMRRTMAEVKKEIQDVKDEITYNGGTVKLRDAVRIINERGENNAKNLYSVLSFLKLGDQLHSEMRFKLDQTGDLYEPNNSFLSNFSFAEIDIKGRNWEKWLSHDDLKIFSEKLHRSIKHHSDFQIECTIKSKLNVERKCKIVGLPVLSQDVFSGFVCQVNFIA